MIWIYRLSLFEFVEELWEGDSQLNWIILRKLDYNAKLSDFGASQGWTDR
ncbi:hypothetical protein HanPI659440_Chr10g0377641 [Helianthus annuus]|nr:hypothetical protein HanPI659440_Chr10g0377641 [Helianthus annuus]